MSTKNKVGQLGKVGTNSKFGFPKQKKNPYGKVTNGFQKARRKSLSYK